MSESTSTDYVLTGAEIAAKIKGQPAGTHFYVTIRAELPIDRETAIKLYGNPDKVFHAYSSVKVSRATVQALAKDLAKDYEARGGRIPCHEYVSGSYRAFYLL